MSSGSRFHIKMSLKLGRHAEHGGVSVGEDEKSSSDQTLMRLWRTTWDENNRSAVNYERSDRMARRSLNMQCWHWFFRSSKIKKFVWPVRGCRFEVSKREAVHG